MRHWITSLALLCATACASATPPPVQPHLPPPGGAIVIVEPEVKLALLRVQARTEPRPDWSAAARDHIALHARNAVTGRGRAAESLSHTDATPQARQILLLHDAVRVSIRTADIADPAPATLRRDRRWTLGPGASALAVNGATHALIITCDGDFTSTLRAVFVVGAAAAGVLAPTGLQRASASLVDLQSGDIVWKNSIVARPDQDVRTPEGAQALVAALLQGAPL